MTSGLVALVVVEAVQALRVVDLCLDLDLDLDVALDWAGDAG